jgi:dTDP-4-dehydrorhamnose reductase
MPLRLLVTGGTGLLGGALVTAAARDPDLAVTATFRRTPPLALPGVTWRRLDVRDHAAVVDAFKEARPDVVAHCAVAIAPEELEEVIARGSRSIAEGARAVGACVIQMSSDMVFDGVSGPFGEDAMPSPITSYGQAKARAEELVRAADPTATIVRASLLYRLAPPDRSLAGWLLGLEKGDAYPLFTDELRCPAHVNDVADALLELARRLARGEDVPPILHAVGPEPISRHAFGQRVLAALGLDPSLARKARSSDSEVVRPRELVLTTDGTPAWFTKGLRGIDRGLARRTP